MRNKIHQLAEYANWYGWPPRWLWKRLLAHMDSQAGFNPSKPTRPNTRKA